MLQLLSVIDKYAWIIFLAVFITASVVERWLRQQLTFKKRHYNASAFVSTWVLHPVNTSYHNCIVMQVLLTPNVTTEVSMWTVGPLYFKNWATKYPFARPIVNTWGHQIFVNLLKSAMTHFSVAKLVTNWIWLHY